MKIFLRKWKTISKTISLHSLYNSFENFSKFYVQIVSFCIKQREFSLQNLFTRHLSVLIKTNTVVPLLFCEQIIYYGIVKFSVELKNFM